MSKVSYSKSFGKTVARVRKKRNLTQAELAKRSSLHSTFLSGIERGDRNVTLDTAFKIAQALNVSLRDLFSEEGGLPFFDLPTRVIFLKLGGTWDMEVTREGLKGEGGFDDFALEKLERACGFDEEKILVEIDRRFHETRPVGGGVAAHLPWVPGLGELVTGDFLPLFSGDSSHYRPALMAPVLSYIMERLREEPTMQVLVGMGTDTVDLILPFLDALLFDKYGYPPVLISGANRSYREEKSDAPQNFHDLGAATRLPLLPGAYYVFNRALYRGGDFVKANPEENPTTLEGQITFFAPHRTHTRIGFLDEGTMRREKSDTLTELHAYTAREFYEAIVRVITIDLGNNNDIVHEVEKILDPRYPGVIIASHALGNAPFPIRRAVIEAAKSGKLIMNVSRAILGSTSERYYASLSSVNTRELDGASAGVIDGGKINNRTGKALLVRALLERKDQRETAALVKKYAARTF